MIKMTDGLRNLMEELRINSAETYYHCINVKELTSKMIRKMNSEGYTSYSPEQVAQICKGALLHDIGKLGIRNFILTKAGPLTPEEKQNIKSHAKYGYEMIKDELDDDEREIVKNICRYHHERIDGSGYEHITDIPLYVQVVSICDVFAALYFDRIYRHGVNCDEALQMIEHGDSGKFGDDVLDYLKKVTVELD